MFTILREKFWSYIIDHNPDLMFDLQESYSVGKYLDEKVNQIMPTVETLISLGTPEHLIVEQCMKLMTISLKPSRFLYIRSVLEEEFPKEFEYLKEAGTLTYEVIKMMQPCREIFEQFTFTVENQDSSLLRHAIIIRLHDYL